MLKIYSMRWVVLLLAVALPAVARAQTLAERLPGDAILYVGWSGVQKPGAGYAGSNLEAVVAASNLQKFTDEFLPQVLERIAKEDKQAADAVNAIRNLALPMWRHPSAFAFGGVDFANANGPTPRLVLLCDAGPDAAAFKARATELIKQAGELPFAVHVVEQGDLVGLIAGYDAEDAMPKAAADAKSLANNPAFAKALAQVKKEAIVTAYVDVSGMLNLSNQVASMGGGEAEKNWIKARELLGLNGVKQAIFSSGFDGKEWITQAFVDAPAPRKGLIGSLLDAPPISQEILGTVPKNATIAGGAHFDLAALVSAARSAVAAFQPDAAEQFDGIVAQANQAIGLDLQKDLFASLGDEWVYYTDPAITGNGAMGTVLVNRLRDSVKAEESLKKVEKFINGFAAQQLKDSGGVTIAFREGKIGDQKVHYLGLPLISPAWAIADGNLYVALYPEVAAAGAGVLANHESAILENQDFMGLYHRLGEHQASSFQFLDLPRLAPGTYQPWLMLSHLSGVGDLFGVPAPLGILPPLNKLMPNLSPAGQMGWSDPDGYHFTSLAPFPGAEMFASNPMQLSAAQAPLLISVLLPALNRARESAQQVKSAANLKNIGLGAIIYANNHNNQFPRDLGTLAKETDLTASIFVNPRSGAAVPAGLTREQLPEWVEEHSDYVWNGAGKTTAVGPETPLAWEKPEQSQGRINILYADGHVEALQLDEALQVINKATGK